jgi:DNA-binding XRE family transcriptional regulator
VYAKCAVRIRRLADLGHELRRPEADLLRDGICELRARLGTVNYRILYFFMAGRSPCLRMPSPKKMKGQSSRSAGRWSVSGLLLPAPPPTLLEGALKMRSQKTQKRTRDALALVEELTGKNQEMIDLAEQEQANLDLARKIYELRTKAKLSQAELARKVGTTQSVISRLEDADYDGHSLDMLRRIASALERRVEIRFLPSRKLPHA